MIPLDRSRWAAHFQCPRKRYLEYQFLGTGVRLPAVALPLATGSALHSPIEAMLLRTAAGLPNEPEDIRGIIENVQANYRRVATPGFIDGVAPHEVTYVIEEQCALIEGVTWAFALEILPWFQSEFEVLEVEREHDWVIRCSCGLGDGVGGADDHRARGCRGVLLMLRPDFATRRKSDGSIGSWDVKSSGYELDRKQHDHSVQMALSCMGVEKDQGAPVQHYYLLGVLKGKRDFPSRKDRTGLKHQYSPFCYGYYNGISGEWSVEYTSRKGFAKVPLWEAPMLMEKGFADKMAATSNVEWWVRNKMTSEQRKAQFDILGPCQRPEQLEESWLRSAAALELETQGRLALLDEIAETGDSEGWEKALDENFPQSWHCYPYGSGAGGCQFLPVCRGEVELGDLLAGGRYVRREPNHPQEEE